MVTANMFADLQREYVVLPFFIEFQLQFPERVRAAYHIAHQRKKQTRMAQTKNQAIKKTTTFILYYTKESAE